MDGLNETRDKCYKIHKFINVTLHPSIPIFIVSMKQDRKHV